MQKLRRIFYFYIILYYIIFYFLIFLFVKLQVSSREISYIFEFENFSDRDICRDFVSKSKIIKMPIVFEDILIS